MPIRRIEIAIECDEPTTEGVLALEVVANALGLDIERDVRAVGGVTDDGTPVAVAILQLGIESADDLPPADSDITNGDNTEGSVQA